MEIILAFFQLDEETLEKLNISQAEMIHLRTENKDLQLQLRIYSEELEELKKKAPSQHREPLPVRVSNAFVCFLAGRCDVFFSG